MTGITALGSLAGPALAGWAFDRWGSYQGVWFVFAGIAVVALVSILTTPMEDSTMQYDEAPN